MEVFKQKRFFNLKRVEFEFDGITFYSGNFIKSILFYILVIK